MLDLSRKQMNSGVGLRGDIHVRQQSVVFGTFVVVALQGRPSSKKDREVDLPSETRQRSLHNHLAKYAQNRGSKRDARPLTPGKGRPNGAESSHPVICIA